MREEDLDKVFQEKVNSQQADVLVEAGIETFFLIVQTRIFVAHAIFDVEKQTDQVPKRHLFDGIVIPESE